jgi:hypothetical protein
VAGPESTAATHELLEWIAEGRTYAETMDVWGSWCPRHSAWEDAVAARLVRVVRSEAGSQVELTERGRVVLGTALDKRGL